MSRFFKTLESDSESSDDFSDSESISSSASEEFSSSEDEQIQVAEKKGGASRFMRGAADSDSEDSDDAVKRVVKSAQDKRMDELRDVVKSLTNALKINDWVTIQNGNF